uniref:Uncharacterized protein n=1 Tax=Glossina palpalis gambiensis TaxID=67801 RepID=A0A1B0C0S3_9MUSC
MSNWLNDKFFMSQILLKDNWPTEENNPLLHFSSYCCTPEFYQLTNYCMFIYFAYSIFYFYPEARKQNFIV